MDTARSISVGIFEDDLQVLGSIELLLRSEPGFVPVFAESSLTRAVQRVTEANPDVVILDVLFGRESGLRALQRIKQARPQQAVLMHTVVDSSDEILTAYFLGASGYLQKGETAERLKESLRIVAEGGSILSPRIAWSFRQMTLGRDELGWILRLSPAELEVLELLSQGLTARAIAAMRGTAPQTIHKQCEAIRVKAGLRKTRQLLAQVGPWMSVLRIFRNFRDPRAQ